MAQGLSRLIDWKADKPMPSSRISSLMSASRLRKITKMSISYKILCSVQDFPLKNMSCSISIDETEDFNIITVALKAKAFCLFLRSLGRERTITAAGPLYTSCAKDLATGWFWGRACEQGAGHFSWRGHGDSCRDSWVAVRGHSLLFN